MHKVFSKIVKEGRIIFTLTKGSIFRSITSPIRIYDSRLNHRVESSPNSQSHIIPAAPKSHSVNQHKNRCNKNYGIYILMKQIYIENTLYIQVYSIVDAFLQGGRRKYWIATILYYLQDQDKEKNDAKCNFQFPILGELFDIDHKENIQIKSTHFFR
jgi:hypothetical protein